MSKDKARSYHHRQIRTTGGRLVLNGEYDLQMDNRRARVRLLRDRSTDDELKFRLEIVHSDGAWQPGERFTIVADWEGSGDWQLYDAGTFLTDTDPH